MPNIYISKKVKEDLYRFIRSSRISPIFGSPNKFKNPSQAITFLLKIGLKFPLSSLEKIANQVFVEFKMRMSDQEFEQFEQSGKLKEIVEGKLREAEEGTEENEGTA